VAADIVARVRGHAANPGRLSGADLAGYQPRLRESLCTDWGARWRVCGMPPPSSGHLAVMQILGLLDLPAPVAGPLQAGVPGADWLHVYAEAARLAFADRAQYVADPDFVAAPGGRWSSLLDDAYLRQRAALIGPRSLGTATPGRPAGGTAGLGAAAGAARSTAPATSASSTPKAARWR
jgi:gamma-glutamyltranspeptidase/glutathione hydrolase